MTSRRAMIAAASVVLLGCAMAVAAQDEPRVPVVPQRDVIVVSGAGEAHAAPDVAYVTLGVTTQAKKAQDAAQANAAASSKVLQVLRGLGIAERDLQTSGFAIQPMYENQVNRSPLIIGYTVTNEVRATVRDLSKVGSVIDAALDAGANNVQSVAFGLEKRQPAEDAALTEAMQAARRKASVLARAAGVSAGPAIRIEEASFSRPVPLMAGGGMAMARAATPISTGEMTISANVTVAFVMVRGGAPADGGK